MAELPYMPFFVDAYTLDAGHLSEAEHGVYLRLLMLAWNAPGCRLPNDDKWLARKLARTVEFVLEHYRPIIAEFFQADGNWIWQKRQQREWQRAQEKRVKRTESAKVRWEKEKAECKRTASAMHTTPTSTVTEDRGIPPSDPPAKPKRTKAPQGTLLPDDWTPTDDDREYARAKGYSDVDINELADEFRNYWLGVAGPAALKRDWSAVWRSRVVAVAKLGIRSSRRGPGGNGSGGGDGRAGGRQTGRLADTLAVLHRRGSLAGPCFDESRMGRVPH